MFDDLLRYHNQPRQPEQMAPPISFPVLKGTVLTSQEEIREVADILHNIPQGTRFRVQFVKRGDGSIRFMECIKGVQFIGSSGQSTYHAGSRDLFPVFDIGTPDEGIEAGPRNVPLDSVLCIVVVNPHDGEESIHHHTSIHDNPLVVEYKSLLYAEAVVEQMRDHGWPEDQIARIVEFCHANAGIDLIPSLTGMLQSMMLGNRMGHL